MIESKNARLARKHNVRRASAIRWAMNRCFGKRKDRKPQVQVGRTCGKSTGLAPLLTSSRFPQLFRDLAVAKKVR